MEERIHHRRQEPRTTADPALSSGDDESTDGEFEFPCFLGANHGSPALADDLFADGRIRPATFYPVFGRRSSVTHGLAPAPAPATERRTRGQLGRLFLEESRAWNSSSSSSSAGSSASTSSSAATDDLEGAAPESYCVWAPGASAASSPRPRKSGSTGSMARWRRISDLVVGRSHSDGKEKFLFLPANPPTPPIKNPATKPSAKKKTEIGTVAAAQRMSAQYGAAKAVGAATPRRTFLPYREELVGFFANVHGISRSHPHPY
ncbi:uncharacterized protein [Lolium perenne]|uniref:uncharacterized protein n=1 Tax=Lolium perenne TaxID=4522 RepID=UPI0021EA8093|nr:uncharacterized protein LOC127326311 [Lolium perenne]